MTTPGGGEPEVPAVGLEVVPVDRGAPARSGGGGRDRPPPRPHPICIVSHAKSHTCSNDTHHVLPPSAGDTGVPLGP